MTFTPSAEPSSCAVGGDRKCTCVSPVTQPRERHGSTRSSAIVIVRVELATFTTLRTGLISKPLLTSRYTLPRGKSIVVSPGM